MKKLVLITILLILFSAIVSANSINSFTINNGDNYTNSQTVTLNIDATDASQMKFSCDGGVFSTYESYTTTKSWTLDSGNYGCSGGTGSKNVYLKIKYDDTSESSGANNDSIIIDIIDPTIDSFSPSDVPNGDGANGQAISIDVSDNDLLNTVSITMKRETTTIYSNNAGKCSVSGASDTCAFTDSDVDRGAEYTYSVTVLDEAGNEASGDYSFSFTDSNSPTPPTGGAAVDDNITMTLTWNANSEADFYKYSIHRSTSAGFTAGSSNRLTYKTGTSYFDTGLAENTDYYYKLKAIDITGNESSASAEFSGTSGYDLATTPEIEADVCDNNKWCAEKGDITFSFAVANSKYNYEFKDTDFTLGDKAYSSCTDTPSLTKTDLNEGIYYFKVKSCKPSGNSDEDSFILKLDHTRPTLVTGLKGTLQDTNILLDWTASSDNQSDEEDSGISHYNIYRSKRKSVLATILNKIGETEDLNTYDDDYPTEFVDEFPEPETTYYYKVIAVDNAGNFSKDTTSPEIEITTPYRPLTEVATAYLTLTNEDGQESQYYNSTQVFHLNVQFSKNVDQVYIYRRDDSKSKETIKGGFNDVFSIDANIPVDANIGEVKIEIKAKDGIKQVVKEIFIYRDLIAPTLSWNVTERQEISQVFNIQIDVNEDIGVSSVEIYYKRAFIGTASGIDNMYTYGFNTLQFSGEGKLKAIVKDFAGNETEIEIDVIINEAENKTSETSTDRIKNLKILANDSFLNFDLFDVVIPQALIDLKTEGDVALTDAETLLDTNLLAANDMMALAEEKYSAILADNTFEIITQKDYDYNEENIEVALKALGLSDEQILETTQLIKRNGAKRKVVALKYTIDGIDHYVAKIIVTLSTVDNVFPELVVVEAIPKQIIASSTYIKSGDPYKVIADDPTILFRFSTDEGGSRTFTYASIIEMTENKANQTRDWIKIFQTPPLVFLPDTDVSNISYATDATPLINALIIALIVLVVAGIVIYFKAMQMKKRGPVRKKTHEELSKEGKTTLSVLETKSVKNKTLMEEMQENTLEGGSAKGTLKLDKDSKENIEKAKMAEIMGSKDGANAASIMGKSKKPSLIDTLKGKFKKKDKKPAYKKKY